MGDKRPRSIEELWQRFRKARLPKLDQDKPLKAAKFVFYAGARLLLTELVEGAELVDTVEKFDAELNAFGSAADFIGKRGGH